MCKSDTWLHGQQHSPCWQMHQLFLPNKLKCHLNMLHTFLFTGRVDREQHNSSGLEQEHVETSEVHICNTLLVVRLSSPVWTYINWGLHFSLFLTLFQNPILNFVVRSRTSSWQAEMRVWTGSEQDKDRGFEISLQAVVRVSWLRWVFFKYRTNVYFLNL